MPTTPPAWAALQLGLRRGPTSAAAQKWGIKGNAAYSSAAYGDILAVVDAGQANAATKVDIATRGDIGLAFRVLDENSFFVVRGDTSANVYKVMKKNANAYTTLYTSTVPVVSGDKVEAVTSGISITIYVNGAQIRSGTDAALNTATTFGLRLNVIAGSFGMEAAARFDNFAVRTSAKWEVLARCYQRLASTSPSHSSEHEPISWSQWWSMSSRSRCKSNHALMR